MTLFLAFIACQNTEKTKTVKKGGNSKVREDWKVLLGIRMLGGYAYLMERFERLPAFDVPRLVSLVAISVTCTPLNMHIAFSMQMVIPQPFFSQGLNAGKDSGASPSRIFGSLHTGSLTYLDQRYSIVAGLMRMPLIPAKFGLLGRTAVWGGANRIMGGRKNIMGECPWGPRFAPPPYGSLN